MLHAGVIHNDRTMVEMFTEFVLGPLWQHAQKYEDMPQASVPDTSNAQPPIKSEATSNGHDDVGKSSGTGDASGVLQDWSLSAWANKPAVAAALLAGAALTAGAVFVLMRRKETV